MCVCLCVWQRAAKQHGCARLLLAETLRGTDRVVDAEERRGMKEWFHWRWRLLIYSYLLSCCRCITPHRGVWRRDEDAGEEMKHPAGIIVLKHYEEQEEDLSWLFSSSIPLLGCLGVEHLTAGGHSALTCWIITWVTPGKAAVVDYYRSETLE